MFARHLFLALAMAITSLIAACGGGSDQSASLAPEKFAAVKQRADVHAASVTPAQAAEQLLNAAESAYPNFFNAHKSTQNYGAFAFRYYDNGMYLGVAIVDGLGYTQNGIYVVGGPFGTLANPSFQGTVNQFLPGLVIDSGLGGNKTLTVTVTVQGYSSTIQVGSVPAPPAEADFCAGVVSDTTFTSIGEQGGGSLKINSCSFNGTSGNIAATLTYVVPGYPSQTFDYTIVYSYV